MLVMTIKTKSLIGDRWRQMIGSGNPLKGSS